MILYGYFYLNQAQYQFYKLYFNAVLMILLYNAKLYLLIFIYIIIDHFASINSKYFQA